MHPGNHKLLQLELKQEDLPDSLELTTQMDTTDNATADDASDFQRVGEFAQMG